MRVQTESAHGFAADLWAENWPTCLLCFFTRLTRADPEMLCYDATAIDPVTTPATVLSLSYPPEQTSPTTLHASKGRDQSPGACTYPPRYTIPPPSHRRFHYPGPPSYYDRWRWHAASARSSCCQSPDTLAPGNAPGPPSCSRH